MERGSAADADRIGPRVCHVAVCRRGRHRGVLLVALTLLVLLPLAGSVLVLMLGRDREHLVRQVALAISLVTFALSIALWWKFDPASADYQFVERHTWLPDFGISYHVGVDGISLLLV